MDGAATALARQRYAGIGDAGGDGACDDVDCEPTTPTSPPGPEMPAMTAAATINDMVDANCGLRRTLNTCPGTGDNDGDGICADVL